MAIALIVVSIFMTSGCHPQIYPDGNLAFIGKAIPILRPTFYAPGGPAARAFESEVAWCGRATKLGEIDPNVAPPFAWTSFAQLDGAVEPHLAPLPRADLGTLVAEFLHISDAQIRDEALYEEYDVQRKLGMLDGLIPVTVRNGLIERNDCLTFAAFLSSYSKGTNWVEWKPHRFIVHTGDLLDISVRTELIPALQAMRDAKTTYGAKIYSVAGNHDGSTFGNIPDSASDTRALGINRSEFVLAHLLFDPPIKGKPGSGGFGFGANEILVNSKHLKRPGDRDKCGADDEYNDCATEQLEDVVGFLKDQQGDIESDRFEVPTSPTELRSLDHVSGLADAYGQQLGYYRLGDAEAVDPREGPGARFLVLDTRERFYMDGELDPVQLGWLKEELRGALERRLAVIVFAHHAPCGVKEGGKDLRRLLDEFPNVAAYFYGHGHWNTEDGCRGTRPLLIQTGSLADFPQAGRDVRIFTRWNDCGGNPPASCEATVKVWWQFWRPRGTDDPDGRELEATLDATLSDARKEHNESLLFFKNWDWVQAVFVRPGSDSEEIDGSTKRWISRHLGSGFLTTTIDPNAKAPDPRLSCETDKRRRGFGLPLASSVEETTIREASAVAVVGDEVFVAGDDEGSVLWRVKPGSNQIQSSLPLSAPLDDVEAMTAWDDHTLVVMSAFGCRKGKKCGKRPVCKGVNDEENQCKRERLALVATDSGVERVAYDLRQPMVEHLRASVGGSCSSGQPCLADANFEVRRDEEGGLNVEGIVRWRDELLIGLRGPTWRGGGAVVIPLKNPIEVITKGREPRFGPLLKVDAPPGYGVRDLTLDSAGSGGRPAVLALLGPVRDLKPSRDGDGPWFRVVRWFPGCSESRAVAFKGLEICSSKELETCRPSAQASSDPGVFSDGKDGQAAPEGIAVLRSELIVVRDVKIGRLEDSISSLAIPEANGSTNGSCATEYDPRP